jgi:hypothetical protein
MLDVFLVEIVSKISKSTSYLRNNKADGEKNVRCFPECSSDGHCASGFCGSSIKAILKMNDKDGRLLTVIMCKD